MRAGLFIAMVAAAVTPGVAVSADMRLVGELTVALERKFYETNVGAYTPLLKRTGLNPSEADRKIHETALAQAKCTVAGFRDQAEAQAIPAETVYTAILGQLRGEPGATGPEGFDFDQANARLKRCNELWPAMMQDRPGVLAFTKLNMSGPMAIPDTGITFVPPIGLQHDGSTSPFTLRSDDASTAVAVSVKNKDVSAVDIEKLKASFRRVLGKSVPNVEWHQDAIMDIGGRQWILLEMSSRAPGFDLHKLFVATGYRDKLVIYEVNATEDGFKRFQGTIWASILSISLPETNK